MTQSNETNFIGYEYRDISMKNTMKSVYIDGYQNFGWITEGSSEISQKIDTVTVKFKRDRKIRNKAELTRLQRQFDAGVGEIESLERSKDRTASVAAYVLGALGTAFMAGSVFAVTANMVLLCIILAVPAFVGWILPLFCYRSISAKRATHIAPMIEQKYDEIYEVCEKASRLLNSNS